MHSVTLVSAILAAGALAEPLHQGHAHFHKRQDEVTVYQTDVATATATQFVTYGQQAAPSAPANNQPQGGNVVAWTSYWTIVEGASSAPASSTPAPAAPTTTPSSTYVAPSSSQPSSAAAASSSSSSSSGSGSYGSTGVDYVDLHNTNRQKHGAPAIAHDANLESRAQNIVNSCPGTDKDDGQQPPVGSNWAGGTNLDYAGAMSMWYGEEPLYAQYSNNYQSEPNIPSGVEALHFSQVVWDASTHVGCAMNSGCSGGIQVTCLYSPQGNFAMMGSNGQSDSYVQNVKPPVASGE